MPKIRDWEDDEELDNLLIKESVERRNHKAHARFKHGQSLDTRKWSKVKRTGKAEYNTDDEE